MPRVKSVEGWMAVVVIVIITTRFNFVPARNNSFPIEYNNSSKGPRRVLNQPASSIALAAGERPSLCCTQSSDSITLAKSGY